MVRSIGWPIRRLPPGYFTLVMATGIVSIASSLLGMPRTAWSLFSINILAYVLLWLLTLVRVAIYPDRIFCDLRSYYRGPGFLTIVAATCILGSQFILLANAYQAALGCWIVGIALWILILYALFAAIATKQDKPGAQIVLHGNWLLPVVSTQSVAVLASLLAPIFPAWSKVLLFTAFCLFLLGGMLYIIFITLIFQRLLLVPVTPAELTPYHWVDLGAVAITVLAGSLIAQSASSLAFLQQLLPFLLGMTYLFWITATWWLPLLVVLGIWRHLVRRYPIRYEPRYWDIVFPLGMYTASTLKLAEASHIPLEPISRTLIYVALAAWTFTFLGLLYHVAGRAYWVRSIWSQHSRAEKRMGRPE
ncbi:MAG TPA: tellurite resistance/C4-dicarboxylate transporter family protein [Lacipirellulaceae bacterium]|nr:tellurite resistance/C4-dicarboxylate transporter family protein [Lacipirellulaceae bacterium]